MDDTTPANEPSQPGLNKIDLSQLQAFNFGTQWTEVKPVAPGRRERDFDRGDRPPRRDDGGGHGAAARDRRAFRKPAGPATGGPVAAPGAPAGEGQPPGERRRFERREGGGPRRDFQGGERREGYERREGGQPFDRQPYFSPYFVATCYPEDTGFAAMVKAVRASCRTYQLFEITKAVLEKNDRFVIVVQRARPEPPRAAEGAPAAVPAKPAPLHMSMPDHLPFDTEDAAIQHVLTNNLGAFFEMQEVEIDPPKGNFPIINKCGVTGELLGPPNYHRYQQILQQHYAAKIKGMSFDRFRDSITSVREPEVAAQWLEKMKKAVRYTWKPPAPRPPTNPPMEVAAKPAEAAVAAEPAADQPVETAPAPAAETPAVAAPEVISFDNIEDARLHLMANARDRVVRAVENVRFHGKLIEKLPPGEIRRALEGHVERQRRFPLDTANALRGRLRREGFTIFKKGSRGVSYVCAVKRRFRVPGQVFSETISALIDFIEKHSMIHMKDLPKTFLAIEVPSAAPAAPAPAEPTTGQPVEGATPPPAAVALTPEQTEKLRKMSNDLRWLVMEGYVTEFSDGKLFAPPPMAPQAAKRAESGEEEHDLVDFPEAAPVAEAAPAAEPAPAPAAEAPAHGTAPTPAPEAGAAPAAVEEAPAPVEETKPETPAT